MCEDEGEGEGEGQPRPGEAREDVRSANPNLRPNPRPDPEPRPNLVLTLVLSLALTLVLTLTRSDAKPICCFNCGGTGHKSKDCPEARDTNQACSQSLARARALALALVLARAPALALPPSLNSTMRSEPLTLTLILIRTLPGMLQVPADRCLLTRRHLPLRPCEVTAS